jgi:2-polyprenyl-6-methoxyphenol hydroxylase-like FAD-dependent oxidoreductase
MKAIIVGGGISGLNTGLGLRRAGVDAKIYDRASNLASLQAGGGMHLWNNGMRALDYLGQRQRVEAAGEGVDAFTWYTDQGRLMGSGDVTELTRKLGIGATGITRKDLHQTLAEGADDDLIQFDSKCTGFEQDAEGVTVRFEDGREERGDVLIGADGINSAVRQQIQGDSEPRYSGVAVCQAVCKTDEQLITPRIYGMQWGRGTRFGYYPILGGAFWYLLVAAPKDFFADPATRRQKCAEHLAGWAPPAEKLLAAVPDEGLIAGNISDREPVRKWGEGRVTLAGDAAHAMTPFLGQGGGQGIEDAAVITHCLSEEDDIPTALRRYEDLRFDRTAAITKRAAKVGETTSMSNPIQCAVRNRVMKVVFPRRIWPIFSGIITTDFMKGEATKA